MTRHRHANPSTVHRTGFMPLAAIAAAAALTLTACSKNDTAPPAPNASVTTPGPVVALAPSAPTPEVAPAPAPAPTPAPVVAQAPQRPVVVAQNETAAQRHRDYERGRRDAEREQQRALPPRADRDNDNAPPPARSTERRDQQQLAAAACPNCGVVESYDEVKVQGQANGVGAVAGGVGGAVLGNRIAGRNNRTLGGIVGAVGGGLIGNAVEKHERTSTAYDVHVHMADGTTRTVRQATPPTVGAKVLVEADGLHTRS